MRRRAPIVILGLLALGSGSSALGQQALVLNRGDNTAVLYDLTTGAARWEAAVGANPHEVARDPASSLVLVSSYGGNTVHVLDVRERRARAVFAFEGESKLHGIWVGRTEPVVWVTAEASRAVLEIDRQTGAVIRTWDTNQRMSHMIVGTPDDAKLYVANTESGTVTVIDRRREAVTVVPTGAGAEGIDIAPDGSEVWVTNNQVNTISVIEVASDRVIASLSSNGAFPVKLRFTPDGRQVWVANNRSGTVAVFDARARALLDTLHLGRRPLGIGFSRDGEHALVTLPATDEVVWLTVSDRQVRGRIATGRSPDGVAWIEAEAVRP